MITQRTPTNWIQTHTGRQFYPLDPSPFDIDIQDIAHALSNMCRFNGHTKEFYSVAQHSVLVSEIVPSEFALWGLLHDASEAYIADITRPVKPYLTNYKDMEEGIEQAVADRFELPWPMPAAVKRADLIALNTEKRDVMGPSPAPWSREWEATALEGVIYPQPPKVAREKFMQRFMEIWKPQQNWSL